jgi:thioredoxin-dependent peroxiredoxin
MSATQPRWAIGVKKGMGMAISLGGKAPSFTLQTDSGGTMSVNDLEGRITVLFFYPKDDTTGCTLEAKDFSERTSDFHKIGAEVIGISPDGVKSHGKFKNKHGLSITLLSDESKDTIAAYGLWVEKSMYGRKYMGVARTTLLLDPDGKVARIWEKVKVPGHAAEVLEEARLLKARLVD